MLEIQQSQDVINRSQDVANASSGVDNDDIITNIYLSSSSCAPGHIPVMLGDEINQEQEKECTEDDDDREIPFLNDENIRSVRL